MVTTVPVRSRCFSSSPLSPVTISAARLQGHLHLGDGRDRDLRRQDVVQHMVVAQIGVGQHIVADGLAGAQAAAVADHQPGLGPQHRQVVGDGLGVGGADADVDQRDAAPARRHQVIGRHLVLAPGGGGDRLRASGVSLVITTPAGAGEALVRSSPARRSSSSAPAHELVDVAMVVGEQHVGLHVVGRRAGVVGEPRQREIGARAVEQGQRPDVDAVGRPEAVGDLVADGGEFGGGEMSAEFGGGEVLDVEVDGAVQDVGKGDVLAERTTSTSTSKSFSKRDSCSVR